MKERRALLVGHFSTFGDLEVLDVVKSWLEKIDIPFEISPFAPKVRAGSPEFVDAMRVDPQIYSHLIAICGPFPEKLYRNNAAMFARFAHCTWLGVNLTMIAPKSQFNPFDALIERDSDTEARPDLAFLKSWSKVPVVGLCLATKQGEYGDRRMHDEANDALRALIAETGAATVPLDTLWPPSTNQTEIETAAQFMSLAAKLDVILTTRLHGLVLGLKSGTPVLAIDAIRGGDKVSKQAAALGWPECHQIENVDGDALRASFERCMSTQTMDWIVPKAREALKPAQDQFLAALDTPPASEREVPSARSWSLKGMLNRLKG